MHLIHVRRTPSSPVHVEPFAHLPKLDVLQGNCKGRGRVDGAKKIDCGLSAVYEWYVSPEPIDGNGVNETDNGRQRPRTPVSCSIAE